MEIYVCKKINQPTNQKANRNSKANQKMKNCIY